MNILGTTVIGFITGTVVSFLCVSLFSSLAKKEVKKSEKLMDENSFTIRHVKPIFWLGVIDVIFFGAAIVLMTIFPNDTAHWVIYLIFSFFAALGFLLIFSYRRWEVKIENNLITYTPLIGEKKSFTFENITRVKYKRNNQKITVFNESKKLFSIDFFCIGGNVFASLLKKKTNCQF